MSSSSGGLRLGDNHRAFLGPVLRQCARNVVCRRNILVPENAIGKRTKPRGLARQGLAKIRR